MLEYLERETHTDTGRTRKLHSERVRMRLEPATFWMQGDIDNSCKDEIYLPCLQGRQPLQIISGKGEKVPVRVIFLFV